MFMIVEVVTVPGVGPVWSVRMPTVSTVLPSAAPSSAAACPAFPPGGSGTRPGLDTTLRWVVLLSSPVHTRPFTKTFCTYQGNCCCDCCVSWLCPCCVQCQVAKEVKVQGEKAATLTAALRNNQ